MSQLNDTYQSMVANDIIHAAKMAGYDWEIAAYQQMRPSVLWKPKLTKDGNRWCALLGDNIEDGVVGFGASPDEAMLAFDEAWCKKLPAE